MLNEQEVQNRGVGGISPPSTDPTVDVLPKVHPPSEALSSQTGVSTKNAQTTETKPYTSPPNLHEPTVNPSEKHWYALRTTYGREKKAYEYITSHGGTAFLPTITIEKITDGKKRLETVSRLPNIFFAYGSQEQIQSFVYDNVNLPYLRFYYKHEHVGSSIRNIPLTVPERQIRSLQIICGSDSSGDIQILQEQIMKFQRGEKVLVTEGHFKGVEGIVARFRGQQRVGIVIDGVLTAATAYIPTAFLEKLPH